jgi:hypothetical protein
MSTFDKFANTNVHEKQYLLDPIVPEIFVCGDQINRPFMKHTYLSREAIREVYAAILGKYPEDVAIRKPRGNKLRRVDVTGSTRLSRCLVSGSVDAMSLASQYIHKCAVLSLKGSKLVFTLVGEDSKQRDYCLSVPSAKKLVACLPDGHV